MAQLSTKIKEYLKANSVNTLMTLLKMFFYKMMVKVHTLKSGISLVSKPSDSQLDAQETKANTASPMPK